MMDFKFIDKNWTRLFEEISLRNSKQYKFITPFIQLKTITDILNKRALRFKLITRYNLSDFYNGVSSLDALEYIIKNGGEVKGIRNLHSKLYVFDSKEAILSSANLTQAALLRNYEFGMHTSNLDAILAIESYFDELWNKIPTILEKKQINKWQKEIDSFILKGKDLNKKNKFKDYGFNMNKESPNQEPKIIQKLTDSNQYFIKFFGKGNSRANINMSIYEEVKSSGCHWACTYPTNKRPKSVLDGAIIFMGRLVSNPNDIMIYGSAIGNKYKEKRDDASANDIKIRPWKKEYSRYIRLHDTQFINGELKDGISMNELMSKFGYKSFISTFRNKLASKGNVDPRRAYSQQASVELTEEAANWLISEMEYKLKYFGKISNSVLSKLD